MSDLQSLVREVTDLTGAEPPAVMQADAPVLSEPAEGFYLVGLIGGKEVGKSALVNALVGQQITVSTSYGPGTEIVVAYAHVSQSVAVERLLRREAEGKYQIVTHNQPHLVRQVLLDLPDIDSHWADHTALTRRMLRHMLYPVWIQSVEKYADQRPQRLLAAVAEGNDPANFIFCLNKIDQAAQSNTAETEELRLDFAKRIWSTLALRGVPRVLLISATHPDRFELPALRDALSRERSPQTVRHSLDLAGRQRLRSLLNWLDAQELGARAQRLERLEIDAQELLSSRLVEPLLEEAIPRLLTDPGHHAAIVDEVIAIRVNRWPIVNIIHQLLAPVTALWRQNLSTRPTPEALVQHCVDGDDRPLSARLQATAALLHQTHPAISSLFQHRKLWEDMPADEAASQLRQRLISAIKRQRALAIEHIARQGNVLTIFVRWLLTLGAVLWFPIVQPLLEVLLQRSVALSGRELGLLIVQLLGVTYLLKTAAFLLIWFAVLWLALRWDTQRRIDRWLARWSRMDEGNPSVNLSAAVMEWMDELLDPVHQSRQRVDAAIEQTEQFRASLAAPVAA